MPKREKSGFWVLSAAAVFYPLTWFAKKRYRGAEKIPRTGGALLVMNHISHYDPVIDAVFVHRNGRVPRILAKEAVLRMPVFGRMARGAGVIPVVRGSVNAKESMAAAVGALREGKLVLIYPDGTITKDPDGWPMVPRTGVARIALEADVPVIPAARWGTQNVLNGYTRKFTPFPRKEVHILVGDPIDLSDYRDRPVSGALLREVTELIMVRVRDLLAELRDEAAPPEFYRPGRVADAG